MFSSLVITVGLMAALAADEQAPAPIQNAPPKAVQSAPAEQVPAGKYYAQGEQGAPRPVHYGQNNYQPNNFDANKPRCTDFDYNSKRDYCGGQPYGSCCGPRGECGGYAGYPPSRWTSAACGGYSLASCDGDNRCHDCDHCGPLLGCCNMSIHHAYYPQANGYYYFRPYNYTHICQHQHVITAWGGDRRHPYDTRFAFDKVYADMEAEGIIAPDLTGEEVDLGPLGPDGPMKTEPMAAPPAPPRKAGPGDLDNGSNSRGAARSVVKVVHEKE